MDTKTQTALITGGSQGIGFELAKLFAKEKYNLVIVANDKEKLREAALHLVELGAPHVLSVSEDLSVDGAAKKVYDTVFQNDITVDILINDAGVGQHGLFADIPMEKNSEMIHLNILSLVQMTHLFVKDMLKRKSGRIMQLASVASYQPTPLLAVYAATKAFVLSFSDALANELKDSGITVTALLPNATDTNFFNRADMENTVAAQNDPEDPAVVAEVGFKALMKGETHAAAPGVTQQIVMSSVLSNEKIAAMARKQMEPAEKDNPSIH